MDDPDSVGLSQLEASSSRASSYYEPQRQVSPLNQLP